MDSQLALLIEGLQRYVDGHVETGSFLRAVLENNLHDAARRASPESVVLLPLIMVWLDEHAPPASWGNAEKVRAWLSEKPCPACGNTGTHGESGRSWCSTCGREVIR